jgi:hypothetical protein
VVIPPPPPDAGTPGQAESPLAVPTEVAAAPPWIYREFDTGLVVKASMLRTWTLRRAGSQAALTIETQIAKTAMSEELGPWSVAQTRTFVGSITTERTKTTLVLSNGSETMTLVCSPSSIRAAVATAGRRPGRPKPGEEECGNEGAWAPMRMRSYTTLSCKQTDQERSSLIRFAAAPGIEWLYVNDDCTMQGGGYRAIPKDGSVAPPRASLP